MVAVCWMVIKRLTTCWKKSREKIALAKMITRAWSLLRFRDWIWKYQEGKNCMIWKYVTYGPSTANLILLEEDVCADLNICFSWVIKCTVIYHGWLTMHCDKSLQWSWNPGKCTNIQPSPCSTGLDSNSIWRWMRKLRMAFGALLALLSAIVCSVVGGIGCHTAGLLNKQKTSLLGFSPHCSGSPLWVH